MQCPDGLTIDEQDHFWMHYAFQLADKAEQLGEVPVGALVVANNQLLGEGWNQVICQNDPSAHAEIVALRSAGQVLQNYRLVETTLYVTLEPCPMCAGAMVHARVARVVFAAQDFRTGAAGSVFQLLQSDQLNHQCQITQGVMQATGSARLKNFFKRRRLEQKQTKALSN